MNGPRAPIRGPRPPGRPPATDPVEALLDFLIVLKRFRDRYGPRGPYEDLHEQLSRTRGTKREMEELRVLRDARRRRRRRQSRT